MSKLVILVLYFSMLCGCAANGPIYEDAKIYAEKSGIVYVYREDVFSGRAIRPGIIVDGKEYPMLAAGGYMAFVLPKGMHTIKLLLSDRYSGDTSLNIELEEGESAYIKLQTFVESAGYKTSKRVFVLNKVKPDSAKNEIIKCKKIDIDNGERFSKSYITDN